MSSSELVKSLEKSQKEARDLKEKQHIVYKEKIESQYKEHEASKKLSRAMELTSIKEIKSSSEEGIEVKIKKAIADRKATIPFINSSFENKIRLHNGSLTLVCAATGNGKTTASVNIASTAIKAGKSVFIITNEETIEGYRNMIACNLLGYNPNRIQEFSTLEQERLISKCIEISPCLTIIDDESFGEPGATTTTEGINTILKKLETENALTEEGVLIIDYFQNVKSDKQGEHNYLALKRLCGDLRRIKNNFPIPIVTMVQMRTVQNKKGASLSDYQYRIKDCKNIADDATCIVELVASKDIGLTFWTVHKNRYSSYSGVIATKWEKGSYVASNISNEELVKILKTLGGK